MKTQWNRLLLLAFSLIFSQLLARPSFAQDQEINKDRVRTWVRSDSHGRPISVGARIPASMVENPGHDMFELVVPIPHKRHLPFTHLYFMWNPHGHEPPGIYDVPHFDVHFYVIPSQVRQNITCAGADEAKCMMQPSPDALPADYAPTPAGVPMMGWHWVDILSPEFHGQPFTSTMVVGYYEGKMAFIEPMITQSFLNTHPHFNAPIRQPKMYPKSGYYPMDYEITYHHISDSFDVSLTHLKYRKM